MVQEMIFCLSFQQNPRYNSHLGKQLVQQMNLDPRIDYLTPADHTTKPKIQPHHSSQNTKVEPLPPNPKGILSRSHVGVIKKTNIIRRDLQLPTKADQSTSPFLAVESATNREGKKKTVSFNRYTPLEHFPKTQSKSSVFRGSTYDLGEKTMEGVHEQLKPSPPQMRPSKSNNLLNSVDRKQKAGVHRFQSSRVPSLMREEIPLLTISNKKIWDDRQVKDKFLVIPQSRKGNSRSLAKSESSSSTSFKIPSFLRGKHSYKEHLNVEVNHDEREHLLMSCPGLPLQKQLTDFQFQIHIKPAVKKRVISDFHLIKTIGKGAFGIAQIAVQKHSGFICVLKLLQKLKIREQQNEEIVLREIKIQSFLEHKHLTSMYGFFDDEENIYLILELLPGGNFKENMKDETVSEHRAANTIYQVCSGVQYMHSRNVIHRDIKPENMFVFEDYVKLGDFGCAVDCEYGRTTFVGSPVYLSPEQLRKDEYNAKVDVWQIGTILYQLLFGVCPFISDIAQIVRGNQDPRDLSQLEFPEEMPVSRHAKDFIVRALDKNSYTRMTIKSALRHIFLKESKEQFCRDLQ